MSNNSFRSHARRRVDLAVRRALVRLLGCRRAQAHFVAMLPHVRAHSNLLEPSNAGIRDLAALEALVRLSRHNRRFVRSAATWCGDRSNLYAELGSLASHLLGRYPVPPIMVQVWLSDYSKAELHRRWFIEHAAGKRIRELTDMPLQLTRGMEAIFLKSPPHLAIHAALRRAEILGLGGKPELAKAVLKTRLAWDLSHPAFWRDVLHLFINHWDDLDAERVATIVEDLHHLKFVVPLPDLDVRGRTPASVERMIRARTPKPIEAPEPALSWAPLGVAAFVAMDAACPDAGAPLWSVVELRTRDALRREGQTLRHCVGGYESRCRRGISSIWSLRRYELGGKVDVQVTIEVDPRSRSVVQIRGLRNCRVTKHQLRWIAAWAMREGLRVNPGA